MDIAEKNAINIDGLCLDESIDSEIGWGNWRA